MHNEVELITDSHFMYLVKWRGMRCGYEFHVKEMLRGNTSLVGNE